MNAYEYFIHEKWKCALNLQRAEERNAKAEEIEGIKRKIDFFQAAIDSLFITMNMKEDLK